MARPLKTGLDYFAHDCDASSDEKIEALRSLHGNDGYAFYFVCLERIYRSENFELDLSDHEAVVILAKRVDVPVRRLKRILKAALKLKCFDPEAYDQKKVLTSSGIKKRVQVILDERERKRKNYKSKPGKGFGRVLDGETPGETVGETPQIKLKERKGIEGVDESSSSDSSGKDQSFPVAQFKQWWRSEYKQRFGQEYLFSHGKDYKLIKDMLGACGDDFEALRQRAMVFLSSSDDFVKKAGYTLGVMRSQFNWLSITASPQPANGVERQQTFTQQYFSEQPA